MITCWLGVMIAAEAVCVGWNQIYFGPQAVSYLSLGKGWNSPSGGAK